MTATMGPKQIDRFGNVSHAVTRNGVVIGEVQKASSGWAAKLSTGGQTICRSRKAAVDMLDFWISLKEGK